MGAATQPAHPKLRLRLVLFLPVQLEMNKNTTCELVCGGDELTRDLSKADVTRFIEFIQREYRANWFVCVCLHYCEHLACVCVCGRKRDRDRD